MSTRSKGLVLFSVMVILSMVLAACAPAAPEKIIETVIVEVAGTPVVQEKVITATPAEAAAEGPIAAEGLVACLPLPELPSAVSGSVSAAPIVSDVPKPQTPSYFKPQVGLQQGGKVYKVGVFEDVTTTNFFAANGPDNTVWNSYMLPGRLTLYALSDKYFTFTPFVAKDFPAALTQEGDFWVVEIPMREDVKWSDGTAFTAKDVAFTANAILRMGLISGNFSSWYDGNYLDHMEAVSDYAVKIFYHTKPGLARHEWGTLQAPILQEAYWTAIVDEAAKPIEALAADATDEQKAAAQQEAQDILFGHVPDGEPTAAGFTLSKWEKGAFLESAAYADYLDTGLEVKQWANGAYEDSEGLKIGTPEGDVETTYVVGPNVESVVYTIYGSQDASILALKNAEVDFVINPLGLQRGLANQIRNEPSLTVIENNVNGFRYLSFNTRRQPMNDCAFRQAMAVLIDKEFVTGTILQKVAFPLYTFVPEGNKAWYYSDTPQIGKGLDRAQRTNLALAILEQAGYTWEGDQKPAWDEENRQVTPAGRLLMPDGTPVPPLTMLAPSPGYDPLRSTFAIWIETWAKEFGIPLTAELAGFNVIVPKIFTEQAFDMYILGWSLSLFPSYLRDFFSTEQAVPDGNNAGGYSSPDFDTKSADLLTCDTVEACKVLSDEIQILLATELPYVLLFDTGIIEAFSNNVEYPYTVQLSGLQYTHQQPCTLQTIVKVK